MTENIFNNLAIIAVSLLIELISFWILAGLISKYRRGVMRSPRGYFQFYRSKNPNLFFAIFLLYMAIAIAGMIAGLAFLTRIR